MQKITHLEPEAGINSSLPPVPAAAERPNPAKPFLPSPPVWFVRAGLNDEAPLIPVPIRSARPRWMIVTLRVFPSATAPLYFVTTSSACWRDWNSRSTVTVEAFGGEVSMAEMIGRGAKAD